MVIVINATIVITINIKIILIIFLIMKIIPSEDLAAELTVLECWLNSAAGQSGLKLVKDKRQRQRQKQTHKTRRCDSNLQYETINH